MADKSPRQSMSKSGKSLKEKRAAKKSKGEPGLELPTVPLKKKR